MSHPVLFDTHEAERIEVLYKYNILDTAPHRSVDHVVKLAARLLKVPTAIFSLVDTDRIWFKSSVGFPGVQQIDRDPGLCASAIYSDDVYVVEDALKDSVAIFNPLVSGDFGLRFYAGAPLKVREGYNLGTLCIIDKHPRTLTEPEKETLKELSELLVDQLELRLEARKANSRNNQLMGLIAHELKNSLTTIPAYAELIKREAEEDVTITQLTNHLLRASARMKELITDMLEMAQLQFNEIRLKKNNFDIASIIARVASANIVLANAKAQKIYLDIEENIIINADETKMAEIADNLINNAIKYSPRGTDIIVKLYTVNGKMVLEVTDEGPGLNDTDIEKLFTPFTRLSATPTGGENSTGLGLSIVKLLVNAHGGLVYAENNPHKTGAIFKVEIPAIPGV